MSRRASGGEKCPEEEGSGPEKRASWAAEVGRGSHENSSAAGRGAGAGLRAAGLKQAPGRAGRKGPAVGRLRRSAVNFCLGRTSGLGAPSPGREGASRDSPAEFVRGWGLGARR